MMAKIALLEEKLKMGAGSGNSNQDWKIKDLERIVENRENEIEELKRQVEQGSDIQKVMEELEEMKAKNLELQEKEETLHKKNVSKVQRDCLNEIWEHQLTEDKVNELELELGAIKQEKLFMEKQLEQSQRLSKENKKV